VRLRAIVTPDASRAADAGLVDGFGRVGTDLRVSLTDRCSLRCTYCMPPEGLPCLPAHRLLTDDEVIRLITIAVRDLGVTQVRLTGGEPLLRRGLLRILAATSALRTASGDRPQTTITTNGVGLASCAADLKSAGLDRVNISLDTLDRSRFARITGRDRLHDVLAGLAAAAAVGLTPVKINTVLLRGLNDDEAVGLTRWALRHGYNLRFIEQMPLGPSERWERGTMITAADILASRLPDQQDLVTHLGEQPGFAMHLGNHGTGRVDDSQAPRLRLLPHCRRHAVRGEHDRRPPRGTSESSWTTTAPRAARRSMTWVLWTTCLRT